MWETWACKRPDGRLANLGWKPYVQAHCCKGDTVVRVVVREVANEAERTHWSWMDADDTDPAWGLTWPSKPQFQVCFPYGPEAEEAAGKGRPVWLNATEVNNE